MRPVAMVVGAPVGIAGLDAASGIGRQSSDEKSSGGQSSCEQSANGRPEEDQRAGTAVPAPVERSGQTTCWDADGKPILCSGTGHDGDLQPGVVWPSPRFTDNSDGTVTVRLTGLIWLQDASCAELAGTDGGGRSDWSQALVAAAALANGICGLTDSSKAGDWRLPSVKELQSLINYGFHSPALANAVGNQRWTTDGDAFVGVQAPGYWTSTSSSSQRRTAWHVNLYNGAIRPAQKVSTNYIWPVRDRS